MQRIHFSIFLLLTLIISQGCFDVVDITIDDAPPQLVVDAWINSSPDTQTVRLTMSQPYFNNTFAPTVDDARVVVINEDSVEFEFVHEADGNYIWVPAPGEEIAAIGDTVYLGISWNENIFASISILNPVPQIDSIVTEYREDELGFPDGHYAQFYARDLPRLNDTYWIKSFKNGTFLNKPVELNFAWDSAFSPGSETNGLTFITPIREAINRFPDPDTEDDINTPPWVPGDTVTVEIHSINPLAFEFWRIAREQMTNGQNTIFALPLANTPTNIVTLEGDAQAVGFFCISSISRLSAVVEE